MQYTLAWLGIWRVGGMWPHKSDGFGMWGSCEGGNECTLKTQQATQIWVQNLQAVLECIMNLHDVHSEDGVFQCLQSSKLLYWISLNHVIYIYISNMILCTINTPTCLKLKPKLFSCHHVTSIGLSNFQVFWIFCGKIGNPDTIGSLLTMTNSHAI